MDALVMCGGEGTRLEADVEKPLFEVGGTKMVDRVVEALDASGVDTVHAAVSPHVPSTRRHLRGRLHVVTTDGDGYVEDLRQAVDALELPVVTVSADLPLLTGDAVDRVIDEYGGGSLTVCVPSDLKRLLGLSSGIGGAETTPTGVNVVSGGGGESLFTTYDVRFAVNVNYTEDAEIAEVLL